MGNDIHLFAAKLRHKALDALRKLRSALLNGSSRLMVAVVNRCAVLLQFPRNSAPVIEEAAVPEKDTVDHQNGILRPAELLFFSAAVDGFFFTFHADLSKYRTKDKIQHHKIDHRDHTAEQANKPHFKSQLDRGEIDAEDAVPEQQVFQYSAQHNTPN